MALARPVFMEPGTFAEVTNKKLQGETEHSRDGANAGSAQELQDHMVLDHAVRGLHDDFTQLKETFIDHNDQVTDLKAEDPTKATIVSQSHRVTAEMADQSGVYLRSLEALTGPPGHERRNTEAGRSYIRVYRRHESFMES